MGAAHATKALAFQYWRQFVTGSLLVIFLFSNWSVGAAEPSNDAGAQCTSDVMLVLDASGSMAASDFADGAPDRMQRVRVALARVVPAVSRVRRVGLIVYGPGKSQNSCRHVDLKFTPMPDAAEKIFDIAERLRPAGRTPLVRSVELAIDALKGSPRPAEIVVLTDGEDTCGGDPCSLAQRLKAASADVTVHVVGFRLPDISETTGARCLADATGGKFAIAESTDELEAALRAALSCAVVSHAAGAP